MKDLLRILALPAFSLFSRVRSGEGGLVMVTGLLLWLHDNSDFLFIKCALAGSTLALMYAFNDIHDAPTDIADPRRNNAWTTTLVDSPKTAYLINAMQTGALTVAIFLFAAHNLPAFSAAFATSFAYSLWGKRIPLIDFLLVFLWGPAFVLAFSPQTPLLLAVNTGLMIMMSHTFQMDRDLSIDQGNGITTSAVYSIELEKNAYYTAALGSIACFGLAQKYPAALLAAFCLLIHQMLGFSKTGWLITKTLQGLAWLTLLFT